MRRKKVEVLSQERFIMPAYSLLFVDKSNAINHSKRIECVSDREAVDITYCSLISNTLVS